MNKNINSYNPLELKEGFYLDKYYENYQMMQTNSNSSNWKYNCTYQLLPKAISGHHQILHLSNMQIAYSKREGGMMQDIHLASDTISIAVMEECADKMCFYRTKLETNDIIFFDSSRSFNLITNDTVRFRMITIKKNSIGSILPLLINAIHKTIKDSDNVLSTTLKETWEYFTSDVDIEKKDFKNAEAEIYKVLKKLLSEQTPAEKKLTKGEKISLNIREQVYNHMDAKISIKSLSKQHNISEKTMQNSFKSLFGFTPNKFLRNLKLNLVYHNLKYSNYEKGNVQKIANRWGFMHMGHFSNYYTKLFGEYPSQTLLSGFEREDTIIDSCVNRKEELN